MGRLRAVAGRIAAARAEAADGMRIRPVLARQAGPLLLGLLCLWLFRDRLQAIDPSAVGAALSRAGWDAWLAALAATAASFAAVGQYDAVLHRAMGTGLPAARAARAGMAAIAIGQTAGFGLVTGTFVRWRLVPGLGFRGAARLTAAVTASFLGGWAVVTAVAVLVFMDPAQPFAALARPVATLMVALAGLGAAICLAAPGAAILGRRIVWPSLPLVVRILALTAVDTLAAAAAFHVFLPDGAAFAALLPAFLIALGAGLAMGTPGGVGPFELTLAALLPQVGTEPLAAALIGYRVVYFALPAVLGGIAFLIGPAHARAQARGRAPASRGPAARLIAPGRTPAAARAALRAAARAEALLHGQAAHALLWDPDRRDGWLAGRAGPAMAALFDPLGGARSLPRLLPAFASEARALGLVPCLYKIGPATAARARLAGWTCHPVAEELWLTPAAYATAGPDRATLRRKLRHAARAGVTVSGHAPGDALPWAALGDIAARWRTRRGGERGFSMGRFAPAYLAAQRVYVATAGGRVAGFATFHDGAREWTLDLIRVADEAPDGTAALLIDRALGDARALGLPRLSLAAVPLPHLGLSGAAARAARRLTRAEDGLARFKTLFAPRRTRLYLAAPSRPALALAALAIALRIRWPTALRPPPPAAPPCGPAVHDLHEKLAFDNP